MLKKVITLVAVIAVLGLMSVAAASASERARVGDDVAKTSAGLQVMEATQLQQQLHAQDPAIGEDAARIRTPEQVQVKVQVSDPAAVPLMEQTRTRTRAQLMTQNPECTDCDGPDQDRSQARLHQNAEANAGSNRNSAGNAGPNGSAGSGGALAGRS